MGSGCRCERGSVTAELALALPAVTVLLSALIAVGVAVIDHVQVIDAARAAARASARGDSAGSVVAAAQQVAPGCDVDVGLEGALVRVRVTRPLRLPLLGGVVTAAAAVAQREGVPP